MNTDDVVKIIGALVSLVVAVGVVLNRIQGIIDAVKENTTVTANAAVDASANHAITAAKVDTIIGAVLPGPTVAPSPQPATLTDATSGTSAA